MPETNDNPAGGTVVSGVGGAVLFGGSAAVIVGTGGLAVPVAAAAGFLAGSYSYYKHFFFKE
jgi:hypothetical protein